MHTTEIRRLFAQGVTIMSMILFGNCECEPTIKPDLYIKRTQVLTDYFGQPIVNAFTGKPITEDLPNALFYNLRSGEYFSSEFAPKSPLKVGDVIQFMSVVTNSYETLKCQVLGKADPSIIGLPIDFVFPDGRHQLYQIEGVTPSIQPFGSQYGVGEFQLAGPGTIVINPVVADVNNLIDEFDEGNNVTQIGKQVSTGRYASVGILVKGLPTDGAIILRSPVKTIQEMSIVQNLVEKNFSAFITGNYLK